MEARSIDDEQSAAQRKTRGIARESGAAGKSATGLARTWDAMQRLAPDNAMQPTASRQAGTRRFAAADRDR